MTTSIAVKLSGVSKRYGDVLAVDRLDQSVEARRPYFKTPIRGLYLVGASMFPEGGSRGL
jgi:phytoene dehydrogenase-like protein